MLAIGPACGPKLITRYSEIVVKPLLGNEKQERVDKAVRLLRLLNLLPLIKDSGLIGGDLLGVI